MGTLRADLRQQITTALNLRPAAWDGLDDHSPLFGGGLGLDSIDALELIVILERDYGIRLTDAEVGRRVFQSVDTLARYIEGESTRCTPPPSP